MRLILFLFLIEYSVDAKAVITTPYPTAACEKWKKEWSESCCSTPTKTIDCMGVSGLYKKECACLPYSKDGPVNCIWQEMYPGRDTEGNLAIGCRGFDEECDYIPGKNPIRCITYTSGGVAEYPPRAKHLHPFPKLFCAIKDPLTKKFATMEDFYHVMFTCWVNDCYLRLRKPETPRGATEGNGWCYPLILNEFSELEYCPLYTTDLTIRIWGTLLGKLERPSKPVAEADEYANEGRSQKGCVLPPLCDEGMYVREKKRRINTVEYMLPLIKTGNGTKKGKIAGFSVDDSYCELLCTKEKNDGIRNGEPCRILPSCDDAGHADRSNRWQVFHSCVPWCNGTSAYLKKRTEGCNQKPFCGIGNTEPYLVRNEFGVTNCVLQKKCTEEWNSDTYFCYGSVQKPKDDGNTSIIPIIIIIVVGGLVLVGLVFAAIVIGIRRRKKKEEEKEIKILNKDNKDSSTKTAILDPFAIVNDPKLLAKAEKERKKMEDKQREKEEKEEEEFNKKLMKQKEEAAAAAAGLAKKPKKPKGNFLTKHDDSNLPVTTEAKTDKDQGKDGNPAGPNPADVNVMNALKSLEKVPPTEK